MNSWLDIMDQFPATVSLPECAWDSYYTKEQIRSLLPLLNNSIAITAVDLSVLNQLLRVQNSSTGQLDITDQSLSERTLLSERTIRKSLLSLEKALFPYFVRKHFNKTPFKRRRQIIIQWDNIIEKIIQVAQYHENPNDSRYGII